MSEPISTVYYNGFIIEIYWDSNVLVQSSGLWIILPDMTIRNVIYSLGFKNNTIDVSEDILDIYVSSAPKSIIYISSEKSVSIIDDFDRIVDDFDNIIPVTKPYNGCIQSIMKKLKYIY